MDSNKARGSGRSTPAWSILTALLVLAATVAWHLHMTIARVDAARSVPESQRAAAEQTSAPSVDLTILERWHPFGVPASTATTEPAAELPPLTIQLRGIVAASEGTNGRAIILDGEGREASYAVGDTVAEGAVLKAIERHMVLIERGSRIEWLPLPELASHPGSSAAVSAVATEAETPVATLASPQPAQLPPTTNSHRLRHATMPPPAR